MNMHTAHLIQWYLLYAAKRLGFWGTFGLILLIASQAITMTKLSELRSQVKSSQSQLALVSQKPVQIETIQKKPTALQPTIKSVKTIYEGFPQETSLPRLLTRISQSAKQRGLMLTVGDYRLKKFKKSAKNSDAKLVQYEIIFPVKGNYLAIRAWMKDLLSQFPTLAFETIEFRRDNTLSLETEARLEMVLFVKEGD
jgi:Tfp pilus assembly protein PilO